jgi:hypothetical protein
VQRLVQRPPGCSELGGHHLDRDAVYGDGDEHVSLPFTDRLRDAGADRVQQLGELPRPIGFGAPAEERPAFRLDGDLAAAPGSLPQLRSRVKKRELVRPGGETALAAELIEPRKNRDRRVVCAFERDLLEVGLPELRQQRPVAAIV